MPTRRLGCVLRTRKVGHAIAEDESRTTPLVGVGALASVKIARSLSLEALVDVDGVLLRDRFRMRAEDAFESVTNLARSRAIFARMAYDLL